MQDLINILFTGIAIIFGIFALSVVSYIFVIAIKTLKKWNN